MTNCVKDTKEEEDFTLTLILRSRRTPLTPSSRFFHTDCNKWLICAYKYSSSTNVCLIVVNYSKNTQLSINQMTSLSAAISCVARMAILLNVVKYMLQSDDLQDAGLTPTTSLSVPRHRPVWLVCLIVSSLVIFIGAMAVGSYAIYRKRLVLAHVLIRVFGNRILRRVCQKVSSGVFLHRCLAIGSGIVFLKLHSSHCWPTLQKRQLDDNRSLCNISCGAQSTHHLC